MKNGFLCQLVSIISARFSFGFGSQFFPLYPLLPLLSSFSHSHSPLLFLPLSLALSAARHSLLWCAFIIWHSVFSAFPISAPPLCPAFVVVRLRSFFAICLPCRAVYLINYFKDLRPFSLLINLSKVQIKIVFQGSSMSFAGILFFLLLLSVFSPFAFASGCCCCCCCFSTIIFYEKWKQTLN